MFLSGFILQMANPKALVFALLPPFIDPHSSVWYEILLLALTSVTIALFVQLFYAGVAGHAATFAARQSFAKLANRVSGLLLVAAGAGLAAIRES